MKIEEKAIQKHLKGSFGRALTVYEEIDSTNNAAKQAAKHGAQHGSCIIARRQTAGRGRMGRSFYSPKDSGLYMTVILRPQLTPEQALLMTSAVGVAVSRALEQTVGVHAKIKWVNDLYLNGKKICGILAESGLGRTQTVDWMVVGIGLNLTTQSFPEELSQTATSIEQACKTPPDPNLIAAEILNALETVCNQLESRSFLEDYRARSCVLGRRVQVIFDGKQQMADALRINEQAHLIVQTPDGVEHTLCTGEISLKGDFT